MDALIRSVNDHAKDVDAHPKYVWDCPTGSRLHLGVKKGPFRPAYEMRRADGYCSRCIRSTDADLCYPQDRESLLDPSRPDFHAAASLLKLVVESAVCIEFVF